MTHTLLSASALHRASLCPASAALPAVSTSSEYATKGNVVHEYLARVASEGAAAALDQAPDEYRGACAAIELDALPRLENGASEVAFAFNLLTGAGRELGRGIGRNYSDVAIDEIPGTADWVALTDGGKGLFLIDYKTGYLEVPRAAKNWQLRFLALAASRAYGVRSATVALIYVHEGEEPVYDQAHFDELDLCAIEQELRELVGSIDEARALVDEGQIPPAHIGGHCAYCPAKPYCPATTALVRRIAAAPAEAVIDPRVALTDENAAEAWSRITAYEVIVKEAKERIRELAKVKPIRLRNGNVLGEVERSQEKVVASTVKDVLTEFYGAGVADAALELRSSKAAIKRALRPLAVGGKKIGKLEAETLDELRKREGVVERTYRTVTEFQPREEPPALNDRTPE